MTQTSQTEINKLHAGNISQKIAVACCSRY